MSRAVRIVVLLVLGLAGLTFAASLLVQAQMRAWYEKDLNLRARLAVSGARAELGANWRSAPEKLLEVLSALAQNERIMGACACGVGGETLAHTGDYPFEVPCSLIVERMRRDGPNPEWGHWTEVEKLATGAVHLSALPISDGQGELGYVVLAQDMSYVERRETALRQFMLLAFGVLSVLASAVTLVVTRMSWTTWSDQLRGILQGGRERKEFQPILSDVRELVDRLMDQEGRSWTPQRLKETLRQRLSGEKVIVLANREPYMHHRGEDGKVRVMHPASGLVTAL